MGLLLKSDKVRFILNDTRTGTISLSDLEAKLSKEETRALIRGIPDKMLIASDGQVSQRFIQEHEAYLFSLERAWHAIHEELLSYAKQEFGKDEIGVYLDIVSHERFEGLVSIDPVNGALWLSLGVKSVPKPQGIPEFSLHFGEKREELEPYIQRAYECLARAEKGDYAFGTPTYKSHTVGNDEENDNQIALQLRQQFPQYITQNGLWLFKAMHGYMMFENVVVIDVPCIVAEHPKAYETVVEGIVAAVKNLLPKTTLQISERLEKE